MRRGRVRARRQTARGGTTSRPLALTRAFGGTQRPIVQRAAAGLHGAGRMIDTGLGARHGARAGRRAA
jgi:hypothetical protein